MILLDGALTLITPSWGLLIWTTFIFLLLWFILGKYAFRPIAEALKAREDSIEDALQSAEKAKQEMAALQADNDRIVNEAREEKSKILREAKEVSEKMIGDAREKAKDEADKIVTAARAEIATEKMAAMNEVKNVIGLETIALAEKVLKRELNDNPAQTAFIESEVKSINLN